MKCKKCNFDMGEHYANNGASEDGVCNYCGFDQEKSKKTGTNQTQRSISNKQRS